MKLILRLGICLLFLVGCSTTTLATTPSAMPTKGPSLTFATLSSPTPFVFDTETPAPTSTFTPIPPPITPTSSIPTAIPRIPHSFLLEIPEGSYLLIKQDRFVDFDLVRAVNDRQDFPFMMPPLIDGSSGIANEYAFSNNGKSYAFRGESGNMFNYPPVLRLMDLTNGKDQYSWIRYVQNTDFCSTPTFAPDSQHLLAGCLTVINNYRIEDIYLVDLQTDSRTKITSFKQITAEPNFISTISWSPDGKTIAFVRTESGGLNFDPLYLLDATCLPEPDTCLKSLKIIAKGNFYSSQIAWSPDSQKFAIEDGTTIKIFDVANGSFTTPDIGNLSPAHQEIVWSPDGKYIVSTGYDSPERRKQMMFILTANNQLIDTPVIAVVGNTEKWGGKFELYGWIKLLGFKAGRKYSVTPFAGALVMRDQPTLEAKAIKELQPGDEVLITDGPVNADFYTWWKIKAGNAEGWAPMLTYWFDSLNQ